MSDSEPCSEHLQSSSGSVDSTTSLPSLMSLTLPDLPIPSLVARGIGERSRMRIMLVPPTLGDAPNRRVRPENPFLEPSSVNQYVDHIQFMPYFLPGNRSTKFRK